MYQGMPWEPYFRAVQEVALAFEGRPHWGKRHLVEADALSARYPAWERFQAVRSQLDPQGTFTNAHLRRVLGPVEVPGTVASADGHLTDSPTAKGR
jgi:L-gulonolactone oxidase